MRRCVAHMIWVPTPKVNSVPTHFFNLRVFIPPMNEICGYEAKICGYKVGKLNKTKKTC